MCVICVSRNRAGEKKDTWRNIERTGEYVVHAVPERLAAAMNLTSKAVPYGTDELDLVGLTVHAITVNGDPATWSRSHHELMVTPGAPLASGADLSVMVSYDGFPKGFVIPSLGAARS